MLDNFADIFFQIKNDPILIKITITFIAFALLFSFKWSLLRRVSKSKKLNRIEKINFRKNSGNYFLVALVVILFFIWFSHLQSLLVSLVAVAAALVLATKEIIMCVTGGILIRLSEQFKHGDRIEVDGIRGFVVQKNLTTTKLLEIGPEVNSQQTTGKIITIPNSLMLSKVVKNESFFEGYSITIFNFPVIDKVHLNAVEQDLIEWADEICAPYLGEAKKSMDKFSHSEGLNIPSLSPRTKLLLREDGIVEILLKMVVKNSEIADIEQQLLRKFISKHEIAVHPE